MIAKRTRIRASHSIDKSTNGISTLLVVVVIVVVIALAGVGAYVALMPKTTSIPSTTLTSQTVPTTSTSATTTGLTSLSSTSSFSSSTTSSQSTSTTPAQSTSSASSASTSLATSRSSTSTATSGGTNSNFFNLTVTKAIADTPESKANGKPVYIFDVTILNTGNQDSEVVPNDFELVGLSNSVYPESNALAMVIPVSVFLSPGQQANMQVSFALNPGDSPAKMKYVGQYFANGGSSSIVDITSSLPQSYANVSEILSLDTNVTGSAASNITVNTAELQNFSTAASLGNFYTGDIIAIHLNFGYQIGYSGNATFQITTISNSWGFQTTQLTPPLPIAVGSSGADVMMFLVTPQTSFSGTLVIDINVS